MVLSWKPVTLPPLSLFFSWSRPLLLTFFFYTCWNIWLVNCQIWLAMDDFSIVRLYISCWFYSLTPRRPSICFPHFGGLCLFVFCRGCGPYYSFKVCKNNNNKKNLFIECLLCAKCSTSHFSYGMQFILKVDIAPHFKDVQNLDRLQ